MDNLYYLTILDLLFSRKWSCSSISRKLGVSKTVLLACKQGRMRLSEEKNNLLLEVAEARLADMQKAVRIMKAGHYAARASKPVKAPLQLSPISRKWLARDKALAPHKVDI